MTTIKMRAAATLKAEWPLYFNAATAVAFVTGGQHLLEDLSHPVRFALVLTWLVLVVLFSSSRSACSELPSRWQGSSSQRWSWRPKL